MITTLLILMTAALAPALVEAQPAATHHTKPAGDITITNRRLAALSMIESGNRDNARGRAGEISRYQIMPREWRSATLLPISDARDYRAATSVARRILTARIAHFVERYRIEPTEGQVYLLWSKPARVWTPTPAEAERAMRFANLMNP